MTRTASILRRKPNKFYRKREYLTLSEIQSLYAAAGVISKRHKFRNQLMVATCYRHALRVSELVNLQWSQVGLDDKTLWVVRGKKGKSCVHHLEEDEIEAFRELKRITKVESEYVFCTSQGLPLSRDLFAWLVRESAKAAGLGIKAHPHMLRHAKGYMLINKDNVDVRLIQDFMGHKNIQTTVLYTTLDSRRMKGLSGW